MYQFKLNRTASSQTCPDCQKQFSLSETFTSCPHDGALLVPVFDDPLIGAVIDQRYKIESLIASGSSSNIYKGEHLLLDGQVAVKVLQGPVSLVEAQLARFQNEARAAIALVHPNIVRTFDYGTVPQPYIVMEFIDGKTLADILSESGALPIEQALKIVLRVCHGMQAAHDAGLIHRDLKPGNLIMQSASGLPRIIDFGVCKTLLDDRRFTRTGEIVGSPAYMSPEQCRGEELDIRSDVYSLGCVLFEFVTGKRAFEGSNIVESMYKHLESPPPALKKAGPDLAFPRGLNNVVARCLAKNREIRYPSMSAVMEDIELVLAGKGAKIKPLRKTSSPQLLRVIGLPIAAAIALILFLLFSIYQLLHPNPSNNVLALGTKAHSSSPVSIEVNPAIELDGMTQAQIFELRKRYAAQHRELFAKQYAPSNDIFGKIVDKRPWLGIAGWALYGPGPHSTDGPSYESISIVNPFILTPVYSNYLPQWNLDVIGLPEKIRDFPYVCDAQQLLWTPAKRRVDVTYDISAYKQHVLRLDPHAWYDSAYSNVEVQTINARDLGFLYMEIEVQSAGGSKNVLPAPVTLLEELHGGNVCGFPCNNSGEPAGRFYTFPIEVPCTARITLWRQQPANAAVTPDLTEFVHFK